MKLKVLFDRDSTDHSLRAGWGISFLVGENILFDTGESFEHLAENARAMKVDLTKINKVVISHEHWDHVSGLWGILNMSKNVKVYICPGFKEELKEKIKAASGIIEEVGELTEIEKNIYLMGNNLVIYKGAGLSEQMLFIKNEKLTCVCGCCHPGVINILHKAGTVFQKKVDTILGGLHLMDKEQRFVKYIVGEMAVQVNNVYSSHCTGHDAEVMLKDTYKERFSSLKAGMEIEV
jgi:7,8-dihydropterin-6-yl-methyl-4-(beta-D-ribofuranosyl)aminobenzene 5'-phosphate synthase